MPATNKKGAKHTFEEMHAVCRDIKNMEVFSYPQDAFNDTEYYNKIEILVKEINKE